MRGLGREGGGSMSGVVRFWESSGGCGGGVSVEKVGLDCWRKDGFGGRFRGEFWVVLGFGRSTRKLEVFWV